MAGYIGSKAVLLSTTAAVVTGDADISGDLTVDTNTLFVDAANNRVGVGTSNPSAPLEIIGGVLASATATDGTGAVSFDVRSNRDNAGQARASFLALGPSNSNAYQAIRSNYVTLYSAHADLALNADTNNSIQFWTGGNERARVDASGHLIVPAGVTLGTSAGVYNAANTLDDYEEGTWTPSLGGLSSVTYSYNLGSYRKVGSLVVAFWDFEVTASSGTFNSAINDLPFTVNSSMAGFSAIQHRSSNLFNAGAVGTGKLSGFAQKGSAYLALQVDYQTNTINGFGFANDVGFNGTGRSTGYIIYESI